MHCLFLVLFQELFGKADKNQSGIIDIQSFEVSYNFGVGGLSPNCDVDTFLKGKFHGFLTSFVKYDEIRPSISCQIILE